MARASLCYIMRTNMLIPKKFAQNDHGTRRIPVNMRLRIHGAITKLTGASLVYMASRELLDSMTLKNRDKCCCCDQGHAPRTFRKAPHFFAGVLSKNIYFCETIFCYHVFVHMLFPSSFSVSPHSIHRWATTGNQTKTWATSKYPLIFLSQLPS